MAIALESGTLLHEDRRAARRARRERSLEAFAPENPDEALDPHHFAERFGLFLIILLGEVVVGLLLEEEPPRIAFSLACIGFAIFSLGRLHETISPHDYLWVLTVIAVVCAALAMRGTDRDYSTTV
jgi:hypothetical protein